MNMRAEFACSTHVPLGLRRTVDKISSESHDNRNCFITIVNVSNALNLLTNALMSS